MFSWIFRHIFPANKSLECSTTFNGSKSKWSPVRDDILQVDENIYLSDIDDLDSVAANEITATVGLTSSCEAAVESTAQTKSVGLTSGCKAAVEPTTQTKSVDLTSKSAVKSTSQTSSEKIVDLFPNPPRKIVNDKKLKSKVVVVRNKHKHKKLASSVVSCDKNKHHHKSHTHSRSKNNHTKDSESSRKKLRKAIHKVKKSIENSVPLRSVEFIANPPSTAQPPNQNKQKPVFVRLGPSVNKPLADYHIPKKPAAAANQAKVQVHDSNNSTSSKPTTNSTSSTNTAPVKLSRTQIKNRNRRLAFKRLREQQQSSSINNNNN